MTPGNVPARRRSTVRTAGAGHRTIAANLDRPASTVRRALRHEVADDAGDLAEIVAAVAEPGTMVRVIAHSSGCHSALAAAALTDSLGDLGAADRRRRALSVDGAPLRCGGS